MSFEPHPDLPGGLPSDTVVWRHVDLYKWLDLLQTSELHLARADQMDDRWEGAYSEVNVRDRPSLYGEHWEGMAPAIQGMATWARSRVYMNCWYVGTIESYAMRKIYDAAGKGVAIRSTLERLSESLQGDVKVHGGAVQYVDYSQMFIPEGNLLFPFVMKRQSFSHENEYRLLAMWFPEVLEVDENQRAIRSAPDVPPPFLREPVDLERLIEAVYVTPDAPDWVADVVVDVTHRYMPTLNVHHSDLAADPVW